MHLGIALCIGERELVTILPEAYDLVVIVHGERLADEPFVVHVVLAVTTEFHDLVPVQEEAEVGIPCEVRLSDVYGIQCQLNTLVLGFADIVPNFLVAVHDRHGTGHQQVLGVGDVHVH